MVAQTNDTDLHQWVRRRVIELQTSLLIQKARRAGGGFVTLTKEENIDIFIEVMSDVPLHLKASRGYKKTGATVAFDKSEDSHITREAGDIWTELGMREKVDSAVAEVERKYGAGELRWNYATVQSLIGPYPRRGHLDVIEVGQEDEATADPESVPWSAELVEGDNGAAANGEEGHGGEDDGLGAVGDGEGAGVPDFDPADWAEPPPDQLALRGDGGAASKDGGEMLSAEQATEMLTHSDRLQSPSL